MRPLAEVSGGLYHLATEQTEALSIRRFSRSLAEWLGLSTALTFEDWEQALANATELMTRHAESTDTVIVATSTLELGIDVGDLDRVIQIDAPTTVSSFLQRLGRSGRRAGTARNCLFLCTTEDALLHATGLLRRWSQGWVEPVTPPPVPRHIVAQQLLALCLQEGHVGVRTWRQWWGELALFDEHAEEIVEFLGTEGYVEPDGDFLLIGREAERRFGRRYFSDLTAVFSAAPEFTVLHGRDELGTVDSALLVEDVEGPRTLLLAGRTWEVTSIDWNRRRCQVEPSERVGKAQWGFTTGGLSFEITRAMREVLLGVEVPNVEFTGRATKRLARVRDDQQDYAGDTGTLVREDSSGELRWWTWAGSAANRSLHAGLPGIVDPHQRIGDRSLRLVPGLTRSQIRQAFAAATACRPAVNAAATSGLKFSAALPEQLAIDTVAARLADPAHARHVLEEGVHFVTSGN